MFIFIFILPSEGYSQWKGQCFGTITGLLTLNGQPNGKPSIPEQINFEEYCSISFVYVKGKYLSSHLSRGLFEMEYLKSNGKVILRLLPGKETYNFEFDPRQTAFTIRSENDGDVYFKINRDDIKLINFKRSFLIDRNSHMGADR